MTAAAFMTPGGGIVARDWGLAALYIEQTSSQQWPALEHWPFSNIQAVTTLTAASLTMADDEMLSLVTGHHNAMRSEELTQQAH